MQASKRANSNKLLSRRQKFWLRLRRNWMLHAMMVLPMFYYFLFEALPLYGLQIAFRDYSAADGIFDSAWIGLKHYIEFFSDWEWTHIVVNTVAISFYQICAGFPIPIILALVIHINQKKVLKKLTHNVAYIPHFISVVVMVGLLNQVLHPNFGIIAAVYHSAGDLLLKGADLLEAIPGSIAFIDGFAGTMRSWAANSNNVPDIRFLENTFRHLYVWSGVWQNMGWSTIIYVAALSGVSSELHEAAKIDGASRWRRVLSVDLPAIMPTISIMLIMRFGSIMSVGYEKVYLMQKSMNIDVSEVISTYVYKKGIANGRQSFGTAIGLLNSAINSGMVILVNKISSWLTDGEAGLF